MPRWRTLLRPLSLYETPARESLATEAAAGRRVRVARDPDASEDHPARAVEVELLEDFYRGWVLLSHLDESVDAADAADAADASPRTLPSTSVTPEVRTAALAFVLAADPAPPYLWGGTVGPRFDCSGFAQAAYAAAGAWIPRDAHQQSAFVARLPDVTLAEPGDLVFFAPVHRTLRGRRVRSPAASDDEPPTLVEDDAEHDAVDHVGVLVEAPRAVTPDGDETLLSYAHCSCASTGRDGIGRDALIATFDRSTGLVAGRGAAEDDPPSLYYGARFAWVGRVERGVERAEDVRRRGARAGGPV